MSEIPVQVRGVDIFKLPLSTTEGFILSRVDGASTVDDISMMCGMDALQVQSILQRLVQLGAIAWGGAKAPPPKIGTASSADRITVRPPAAPVVEQNAARRSVPPPRMEPSHAAPSSAKVERPLPATTPRRPAQQASPPRREEARSTSIPPNPTPKFDSAPATGDVDSQRPTVMPPVSDPSQLYDATELNEDVEIDMERRKRILDAYKRVQTQTYYECLGLDQDADKAAVKRAYFELSKQFHPDSLFGRRLGAYKHKMESVFKRLTEAYDVLSKKKARQDYDEYLAATAETRRAQDILARANREAAVIEQTIRASMQPKVVATPVPDSEPPLDTNRLNAVLPPPGVPASEPPQASLRPPPMPRANPAPDDRRRMAQQVLRRRLDAATGRGSSLPPAGPPSSAPPTIVPASSPPDDGRRKDAIRGLARSLRDAHVHTGQDRIAVNYKRAQDAEAARDLVGASNFYRLALAAAPDRADLQQEYERVSAALAAQLADSYEKQAQYEERSGRWPEASQAWVKVCDGRPKDPRALRSAASALLRANGDLHAALKYAKLHVELAGENAGNLTLLARVYLGAGLKLNARRELEKAAKLDPSDEMIKNLLKEAR